MASRDCFRGACATADEAPANKAEETDSPADGKLDAWSITDHGPLAWVRGDGVDLYNANEAANLSTRARAIGFTFTLSGEATLSVALRRHSRSSANIDTVMYLYRQGATGNWGRYIARNDDVSDQSCWSAFNVEDLDEGTYRVVVKGYSRSDVGEFRLDASCTGAGCIPSGDFESAFNAVATDATYASESDHTPQYVTGELSSNGDITVDVLRRSIGDQLRGFFAEGSDNGAVPLADLRFEAYTGRAAYDWLERRVENASEDSDLAAWETIRTLATEQLTNLTFFKVGLAMEGDDGVLQENSGLYAYVIVGKDSDGKLVGFLVGSVET
ncbi:MAG: DVUA0089 family protein [Sandaracinaceae bacterium]|nr:DVUA0089 family protein [Sandaracinaceae bacterium]